MLIINGIEEKILVERIISGDQTAFELIFRFYYPGLVVFTSQITLNQVEAEEIVQDFFVRLWIKRENINSSFSLKNFMFTSVKNSSLNYLKKEKIKGRIISELTHLIEYDELYDPGLFIASELQNQVQEAFNKLPQRTREIFILSRFKGKKNDEIAEQLNLSKRTVETQISNALRILRVELKDYFTLLLFFWTD